MSAACDDMLYIRGRKLLGFRNALPTVTMAGIAAPFTYDGMSGTGEDVLLVKPLPGGLPTSRVPFEVRVTTDGGSTGSGTMTFTLKGNMPTAATSAATG